VGVRCIVKDPNGRLLFVKHRGQSQWFLPGGMVKRREYLYVAISRELLEESGIEIASDAWTLFGCYTSFLEGRFDCVIVYEGKAPNASIALSPHNFEIEEAGFFDLSQLPASLSPATRRRIKEYQENIKTDHW